MITYNRCRTIREVADLTNEKQLTAQDIVNVIKDNGYYYVIYEIQK